MKRTVTAIGLAAVLAVIGVLSCGSEPDCATGTVRVAAFGDPAKLPAGGGTVTVQIEQNGAIVATANGPLDFTSGRATVDVPLPNYRSGDEVIVRAHLADYSGKVVGTWFNLVKLASGCQSLEANLFLTPITDAGVSDGSRPDAPPAMPDAASQVPDAAPMVTVDAAVQLDAQGADAQGSDAGGSDSAPATEDAGSEDAGVDAP